MGELGRTSASRSEPESSMKGPFGPRPAECWTNRIHFGSGLWTLNARDFGVFCVLEAPKPPEALEMSASAEFGMALVWLAPEPVRSE